MAQYIISAEALERNARILQDIGQRSGAKMLVALKAFSTTGALATLKPYAHGCCASGLYEARLGRDHLGGEIAVYSPAYQAEELQELLDFAHHIDFNSIPQYTCYRDSIQAHPRYQRGEVKIGLRINPCHSTGHTPLYDPCVPGSRLGITKQHITAEALEGIQGLHIHTLCEQGAQDLVDTFRAFESDYAAILSSPQIQYLNLGGGHWITKPDYDRELLISLIQEIRQKYNIKVYLEPGEAWSIHTGVLRARVLDVFESLGYQHAILDVSASAHMPDVLEMPYRPDVYCITDACSEQKEQPAVQLAGESYQLAGTAGEMPHSYRLGAPTCLAGDVIGDYSFPHALQVGEEIVLDDMSHYTIVKTSHFNGVAHPDIVLLTKENKLQLLKEFHYSDFLNRLG